MANVDCPHPEIRNFCLACGESDPAKLNWIEYYESEGYPSELAQELAELELRKK